MQKRFKLPTLQPKLGKLKLVVFKSLLTLESTLELDEARPMQNFLYYVVILITT